MKNGTIKVHGRHLEHIELWLSEDGNLYLELSGGYTGPFLRVERLSISETATLDRDVDNIQHQHVASIPVDGIELHTDLLIPDDIEFRADVVRPWNKTKKE